jgi:PAS domain S-box-containing protein
MLARAASERIVALAATALGRRPAGGVRQIFGVDDLPPVARRLVLLATALVIAAVGAGAALTLYRAATERAAIEQHVAMLARFTAHSIDREYAAAEALLTTLSVSPTLRSGDFATFYRIASEVPKPAGSQIVLADLTGRQLVNTIRPFGFPHEAPSEQWKVLLAGIAAHNGPVPFNLFYGRLRQEWVVGLGLPVVAGDSVRGVLTIVIPSPALMQILDEHRRPADWPAMIVDGLGQTIAYSRGTERHTAQPGPADLAAGMTSADFGTFAAHLRDGSTLHVAYARSISSGWIAIIAVPFATLSSPLRTNAALLAIGGAVLLLLAVGAALLVGRGITRPVEQQLRLSDERFQAMANTTPAMLFMAGPDGSVEYANDRFYETTGTERVPDGTLVPWRHLVHPDDLGPLEAAGARCLATSEPFEGEFRLLGRDGAFRWYAGRSTPLRDADGKVTQWFSAAIDIDALRTARELLQSTMDALSARVVILDERGRIMAVNAAWRLQARESRVGGAEAGLGAEYQELCAEAGWALPEGAPVARGLRAVTDGKKESFRMEYACGDGTSLRWFQLRVSRFGSSDGLRLVLAHEDITEIQLSAVALQQVSDRLISSQDEERRRIARELHDSTAQTLAAGAMLTDRLASVRTLARDVPSLATELGSLLRQALDEIRSFSFLLHPPMLDKGGLSIAVRSYASGFGKRCGIDVVVDVPSSLEVIPREIESALFRVVQEGLANIHRHADASRAVVRLRPEGTRIVLEIEDDGKGFRVDPDDSGSSSLGVGIPGMRARLRQFGGGLDVRSSPRGTSVRAIIPLSAPPTTARRRHRRLTAALHSRSG